MKNPARTARGFTLVEIMIVVAIIGLLASIAIPNLIRSINQAKKTTCISNLKQIQGAKVQWSLETRQPPNAEPVEADLFGPEAYIQDKIQCGAGGNYSPNPLNAKPTCTIPGHTL